MCCGDTRFSSRLTHRPKENLQKIPTLSESDVDDGIFATPLRCLLILFPRVYNTIIGSRDRYFAQSLVECCVLEHMNNKSQEETGQEERGENKQEEERDENKQWRQSELTRGVC